MLKHPDYFALLVGEETPEPFSICVHLFVFHLDQGSINSLYPIGWMGSETETIWKATTHGRKLT